MFSIHKQKNIPAYIKFFITLCLFLYIKDLTQVNSFSTLAVTLLEFIIILELVRMLIEFLFSTENRIRLRFMIDSTIVFFIRDIMLIVNDKFDVQKIYSILGIIIILFVLRVLLMKFSPSNLEKTD